jgi:hypothetical protein
MPTAQTRRSSDFSPGRTKHLPTRSASANGVKAIVSFARIAAPASITVDWYDGFSPGVRLDAERRDEHHRHAVRRADRQWPAVNDLLA